MTITQRDEQYMAHAGWLVTEHRGPEGLAEVKADWRRLYLEMSNPQIWHSYEAYTAYVEHLCPDPASFRCLALSDSERVRAILLLEERWDRGLFEGGIGVPMRVWGMPFSKENWALTDAIGPEDDARRALLPAAIDYLRNQPGGPPVLALGRVREASALWDGLREIPASTWFAFTDVNEFVMRTDMSAKAFTERLSRNARQMLTRARRRFEALEGTAYTRAATPDELSVEIEKFLKVEASGWKGEHGSAIRQNPREEGFYRNLLDRLRLDGRCEIHSLYAEGRCIASGFWVYTSRECALLKCGYDESYARVSPGRLLTQMTLEQCCEDPDVDTVSMFGDAPWLRHWHPESRGARRAYVSIRPVAGAFFVAALRFRYGPFRRMMRALRSRRDDHEGIRRGSESG